MAIVKLNDMIHEIHGSISKDSNFYYRRTPSGKTVVCMKPGQRAPKLPELTPEQVAEQRQRTKTAAQQRRIELFARACMITNEILKCREQKRFYEELAKKQKRYATTRGYVFAQIYALLEEKHV